MRRMRIIWLNVQDILGFEKVRAYLMNKYKLYSAKLEFGVGRFRIEY